MAVQLERLMEYHREHGNLGNRYVRVIREFNPAYVPKPIKRSVNAKRLVPL